MKFKDDKAWKILDDFLLDCPEISQDEREEIIEFVSSNKGKSK